MRRLIIVAITLATACSQEQPAPRELPAVPPPATTTSTTTTAPATPAAGAYTQAMDWLKTTPRFAFTLVDNGVRTSGEMTRERRGAERVRFDDLLAEPKPTGLTWTRDGKPVSPPEWGPTAYQRITLGVDPQKDEGSAQLAAMEGDLAHYRFTNAANGDTHHVWVTRDSRVARMKIEGKRTNVELELR
jgi:hypothetical protein